MNYPINEHEHMINGVAGRMFPIHAPVNGVLLNQTWKSTARPIDGYGTNGTIRVKIRFDDECKNGHMTFSITGDIHADGRYAAGGCIHDDIVQVFPELAPLIKWHLMSTDGPLHYLANTVYHAIDRDHNGRAAGEVSAWDTVIYFGNSPVSHKISDRLARFITERAGTGAFNVVAIAHEDRPGESFKFAPKYTFAGYGEKWHECPFDNEATAQQWAAGLAGEFRIDKIPTAYSEGKTRDLDAARHCAVWPEATDEQLSVPADELRAMLQARLPGLLAEFRADMERIGFIWLPE